MAAINASENKIGIVVNEHDAIARTVSDGDIRRALLTGAQLDDPVSRLPAKKPITYPDGTADEVLYAAMKKHSIQAVVLTDAADRPVGLRGRRSFEPGILLSPPHMGHEETQFVQKAFDENWIAPAGPNLNDFEAKLAEISDRQQAIALSSGTAALHLALRVMNIQAGARVYVSDLTFVASLNPILYEGAVPVLIDSEPGSWNMSPDALERRLEKDRKANALPAAIIVVHLYGQSADMDSIMALASHYGVQIIEDAAESLGASYNGRPSGAHGVLTAYSFNGNKIITTSGGGALVSDRSDLIDRVRKLSTQGRDPGEHYQHSEIAYNYRMSNILAGIGLAQLDLLSARVAARRRVFDRYNEALSDIPGISFQGETPKGQGSRWLTVLKFNPNRINLHPYQFLRRLQKERIDCRPAWKPMHLQPLCHHMDFEAHSEDQVVSAGLFLTSLCLPSGSAMSEAEQGRVISGIRSIALNN
ncbi:MAG: aminotransferase class I/II-fold pyridoxal phosphate-dependent enzyme [Rhodobacteraceae bacterium]|nr:aminotransferase class I/II-fold pyridoxal phosphate-dependent enzyme [Paracoccaceae bacterium]